MMTWTMIFENRGWRAMRGLALAMLDKVEWRHHGIGALQGYVVEGCEPEVRLHIWSRRLIKPGIDVSGDVHDHRFDMVSHVLAGFVLHEEFDARPNIDGSYGMMALTHARAARETDYHGPTTLLDGRFSVERKMTAISEGFSYTFPARKFHRSPMYEGTVAVTCVEKHQQDDSPARLLYPVAQDPVMAFGHIPDRSVIQSVVAEARRSLEGKC